MTIMSAGNWLRYCEWVDLSPTPIPPISAKMDPMNAAAPFSLRLLGPFALTAADGTAVSLRRQPRALLAYLAVTPPQSRQALADLFCADTQSPNRTLNVLLSRIRRATAADALTETAVGALTLNPARFQVDVTPFTAALADDLDAISTAALETAVALYHDEFLAGLTLPASPEFELWLLGQRAHLQQLLERGLLALIDRCRAAGQLDAALAHARRLLQINPLLEVAHARLIHLYARTGQHDAARRQYTHCRDLLQAELGVPPSADLQQLMAELPNVQPPISPQPRVDAAPPSPDFVGRATEFARLHTLWQQAAAGSGGTVLLRAPAGGGKSRLVNELAQRLPPTAVFCAPCYESTQTLPYQPWQLILELQLQQLDDAVLEAVPPALQTTVARLLPGLAHRLPAAPVAETAVPPIHAEPERLYAAVVDFLSLSPQPRLFFLDDLQWADETSLRLFHYVSQRAARFPWLLIGAFRSDDPAQPPALARLWDDCIRRQIPTLTLAPLQSTEIEEISAHLWSQLAADARPRLAAMLAAATGGNPLFVTAVLRELAGTAEHTLPAALPVPATVQALIQRRLRHLPPGCVQVWEALAVLESPAMLTQLQQISARSEDETAQAIDLGLQWGLLVAETTAPATRYRFHHDLVREAVSATLSVVRRQRLHRRTAVWLAQRAQRRTAAAQEAAAGTIFYHAQQGEAFDLIFQWAPAAAAAARRQFAFRENMRALDAVRAAYAQLQLQPDFDRAAAEPILYDQLLWWLTYSWVVGKSTDDEQAVLQQAEALLIRHYAPRRQALLDYVRAQLSYDYEAIIPAMQQAHTQFLRLEEGALAAAALALAASAAITLSRNQDGRSLYQQALILNRQADDRAGEINCLTGLAWTALNLGEIEAALAHLQDALALSQALGDKLGEAQTRFGLAAGWGFYHHPAQMAENAQAARALYLQMGFQTRAIRPLLYVAAAHDMRGEWDTACDVYEEALAAALAAKDNWIIGWTAQLAGRIYLRRGALHKATARLEQARALRLESGEKQNQVSDLAWLGRLALHQGDAATALAHTAVALALLDASDGEFYVWEQPDVLLSRAEALAAAGETAAAHAIAHRAADTLHAFAAQIGETAVRRQFLAYSLNARVEKAAVTGQFPLWPAI